MADSNSLTVANLGGLKVRKPAESSKNPTSLVYGEGGTGKTTFVATAADVPEFCPVLHLNVENGAESISSRMNLDVVDIDSIRELQNVYLELYNKQGAGYTTVIVDNLTESQSQGLDDILKTGKGSLDFVDFDGASFSNGAWNRSSEQMRKLVRYFRNLPVRTIFVAWERDYADGGPADIGPSFTKTFGKEAPGLVNDVYRLSVEKGVRVLRTGRTDRISAKDRTGLLPTLIQNPTMPLLQQYWTGELVKPSPTETESTGSLLNKKKR